METTHGIIVAISYIKKLPAYRVMSRNFYAGTFLLDANITLFNRLGNRATLSPVTTDIVTGDKVAMLYLYYTSTSDNVEDEVLLV